MPKRKLIQAPDRNKGTAKPSEQKREHLSQLASVFSELLAIKEDLDNFHTQMASAMELKANLNSTQTIVKGLSQRLESLSTNIAELEQQQSGLEELRSGLLDLRKDIEGIQPSNTDELEQKVKNALAKFGIIADRAAEIKQVIENQHEQNTDTALGVQEQDLNMGGHKIVNHEGGDLATKDFVNESMTRAVAVSGRGPGGGVGRYGKPNDGEYARWNKDRIEGRTADEAKADLDLENSDITALIVATKLDDLTAPDDNTDLNASSSKHGLLRKLDNTGSKYLRDDGTWQTPSGGTPDAHKTSHQDAGSDEISIEGLAGTPAALTTHVGASDPHTVYILHSLATAVNDVLMASGAGTFVKQTLAQLKTALAIAADIATHAALTATHGVAGTIAGLADIATHSGLTTGVHGVGAGTVAKTSDITATKIDDLTAGDDNTDLDASTSKHGLAVKATAPGATLINVVGIANGETAYTNKALLDSTAPSTQAIGDAAATGSQLVAARRDHKHAMPSQATMDAASVAAVNAAGVAFAEGKGITLDIALADAGYNAILMVAGTAGINLAFGEAVYFAVADSKWEKAKGDAEATVAPMTGVVVVAGNENAAITVMLIGSIRADSQFPALTVGAPVFISAATAGAVVSTELTTGQYQKAIGWAPDANTIILTGNPDWVKVG